VKLAAGTILVLLSLAGCKREERQVRLDPPVAEALEAVRVMPNGISGQPAPVIAAMDDPYRNNAYQIAQGKRLFEWFNCQGCHANGGGDSGPALMNGWWRYGPDPISIFISIRDGRPNGMPPFRNRLTTEQIWQLVGYVQKVGTTSISAAAPSRNDAMQSRPSENRAPTMLPPGPSPSR